MPTTTYSKSSKFLLVIFASLCIMGGAAAMALPPAGDNDTPSMEKGAAIKVDPSAVASISEDQEDTTMATETKLPTNKRLRRQSNQLVRTRVARTVGDGEDQENPMENPNRQHRDMISCVTEKANDTIPAAHIRGHGVKPFPHSTFESSKLVNGYQQKWMCCEYSITSSHNAHAFVDGGMIFNQTDKSLRVPTCGYYHVFSQIYYQIGAESSSTEGTSRSVFHLLKFMRHCPSWPESNPVMVMGRSSMTHDDTTTYTSDIVHLCAGGKIWVEIPDIVPCCPIGDDQGTFIGAYLVAETTCHWPPDIEMKNLNM